MKKHLIAAAVAGAFAVPAMAQVTLSGSINAGLMDEGQAANSSMGVVTLGGGANAINVAATEDLGGGLSAGFTGQMRFNAATGDVNASGGGANGNLFHAANVFVAGGFGTVRIGKIAEDGNCAFDPWGCTGGAAMAAGTGRSALVASGTQSNSVSYTSPSISGIRVSYQTSVTGPLKTSRVNERSVLNLTYAAGPIAAQYIMAKNSANVAANAAPISTVAGTAPAFAVSTYTSAITDVEAEEVGIAASYDLVFAKIGVATATTENAAGTKTRDLMMVTATVPMGAFTILAGYAKDDAAAATADTKWSLGANYALSKRTTLGADVFDSETATGSTGFVIRARHTF